MTKLAICNMCYIDEYTCAFRDYYYKGVKNPKQLNPTYYRQTYDTYDSNKNLWEKRLNKKWTPRQIIEQYNFLDLDCVVDIKKTIQLWIGYISKQLIDNKISIYHKNDGLYQNGNRSTNLFYSRTKRTC